MTTATREIAGKIERYCSGCSQWITLDHFQLRTVARKRRNGSQEKAYSYYSGKCKRCEYEAHKATLAANKTSRIPNPEELVPDPPALQIGVWEHIRPGWYRARDITGKAHEGRTAIEIIARLYRERRALIKRLDQEQKAATTA